MTLNRGFSPVSNSCRKESTNKMHMNPPGAHRGYTLTYLGKKVGRNHIVAPAGKQLAWETTSPTSEEPGTSSRPIRVDATAPVLEELPGSVPERREDRLCPKAHSTQDRYRDNRQGPSVWKVDS